MQQITKITEKITKGDWERSGKNIQTRGGTFIGCATSPENADIMKAGPGLLTLLLELHGEETAILTKIVSILKS